MFLSLEGILIGVLVALVVIGLIFVIWYISTSNELKRLEQSVEESESGIDVALAKRYDSLTKMLDTTKGYAKHEAETLSNVIKWRNGLPKDATLEDKKDRASDSENGIWLCENHHKLFDSNLITINQETGEVNVSNALTEKHKEFINYITTFKQISLSEKMKKYFELRYGNSEQ